MSCHEVLVMLMREWDAGHACLGSLLARVFEVAHISLLIRDEGVSTCAVLASYRGTHIPSFYFRPICRPEINPRSLMVALQRVWGTTSEDSQDW